MADLLLTKSEAAQQLKCSLRMLELLVAENEIRPVKIGRRVLIEPAELERFVASCRKEAATGES